MPQRLNRKTLPVNWVLRAAWVSFRVVGVTVMYAYSTELRNCLVVQWVGSVFERRESASRL